jgi:uncharacterized membrane protein
MDLSAILEITAVMVAYVMIPGIMLTLAVFPKKDDICIVERLGIGMALGLAPTFILYALEKNLMVPINTSTTFITFLVVSLAGLGIWQVRRNTK